MTFGPVVNPGKQIHWDLRLTEDHKRGHIIRMDEGSIAVRSFEKVASGILTPFQVNGRQSRAAQSVSGRPVATDNLTASVRFESKDLAISSWSCEF